MKRLDFKRAIQLITYLTEKKGGTISVQEALTLIWLADRYHIRNYGRTITGDSYVCNRNGVQPVNLSKIVSGSADAKKEQEEYFSLYLMRAGNDRLKVIQDYDRRYLSLTDIQCMDVIFNAAGIKDEKSLIAIWQFFPEGLTFKAGYDGAAIEEREIKLIEFFENVVHETDAIEILGIFRFDTNYQEFMEDFKIPYS